MDDLRKELIEFMEKTGTTQGQVAIGIGFSASVVSQFLNGTYSGDVAKVAEKTRQYLDYKQARMKHPSFYTYNPEAYNAKSITFAVSYAHHYSKMAIIYGDAGAGKTAALKRYARNSLGVVMVTANVSCKTARAILYLLANAMDLHPFGTEETVMGLLIERLSGTSKLLIIDEADHLSFNALQALRNLYDVAGVGVVLSGNEMVLYQMYVKRNLQSTRFGQIRTRVGLKIKVENSRFCYEELKDIFFGLETDCVKELLEITRNNSLRTAINVCEYSSMLAESMGRKLKKEDIQIAYESAFKLN